ncbi:MAG: fatty acyl-AMP ligase [Planctomycetaceae bacterium]
MRTQFPDLLTMLESNVQRFESREIYRFMARGEEQTDSLTYATLFICCCAIAGNLQACTQPGDRVLIAFHPGLELIVSLLGTIIAGRVPVILPPAVEKNLPRLVAIVANAEPAGVICADALHSSLSNAFSSIAGAPHFHPFQRISTPQHSWKHPGNLSEKPAILQYTSGSTAAPRGVTLTHANLMHNLTQIQQKMATTPDDLVVLWLPPYHDMGLIGGILQTLFVGIPTYLMPPVFFVQKPIRWLRAIHKYRATITGGPNFALRLCMDHITDEELQSLSLDSLRLLFVGAERIRPATLKGFGQRFQQAGFSERAFYPCYGLAESTLISTGGVAGTGAKFHVHPDSGTTQVSCGTSIEDQCLQIVDPDTGEVCEENEVGEILIDSPSVTSGYLKNAAENELLFVNRSMDDGPSRRMMRTGDMGYLHDNELYVTGRKKEVLIIRGRTFYPDELEEVIEAADSRITTNGVACFPVDGESTESLVVICEIRRSQVTAFSREEVSNRVMAALTRVHGISPSYIGYLPERGLPRTTSGKIMRRQLKDRYLERSLVELVESSS